MTTHHKCLDCGALVPDGMDSPLFHEPRCPLRIAMSRRATSYCRCGRKRSPIRLEGTLMGLTCGRCGKRIK